MACSCHMSLEWILETRRLGVEGSKEVREVLKAYMWWKQDLRLGLTPKCLIASPPPHFPSCAASCSATLLLPSSVIHHCCPRHEVYLASASVLVIVFKNSESPFSVLPILSLVLQVSGESCVNREAASVSLQWLLASSCHSWTRHLMSCKEIWVKHTASFLEPASCGGPTLLRLSRFPWKRKACFSFLCFIFTTVSDHGYLTVSFFVVYYSHFCCFLHIVTMPVDSESSFTIFH